MKKASLKTKIIAAAIIGIIVIAGGTLLYLQKAGKLKIGASTRATRVPLQIGYFSIQDSPGTIKAYIGKWGSNTANLDPSPSSYTAEQLGITVTALAKDISAKFKNTQNKISTIRLSFASSFIAKASDGSLLIMPPTGSQVRYLYKGVPTCYAENNKKYGYVGGVSASDRNQLKVSGGPIAWWNKNHPNNKEISLNRFGWSCGGDPKKGTSWIGQLGPLQVEPGLNKFMIEYTDPLMNEQVSGIPVTKAWRVFYIYVTT